MLNSVFNFLGELIFPTTCLGCGAERVWLCPACTEQIKVKARQVCPCCYCESAGGRTCAKCLPNFPLTGLKVAALYAQNALLPRAIKRFKYRFARSLAGSLGEVLGRAFPQEDFWQQAVLVPVPLHFRRKFWRGFNQADLLAQVLSEQFKLPRQNLLKRVRYTLPQSRLKRTKRLQNLQKAFQLRSKQALPPSRLILVDDVASTGATLRECAKVLRRAGAGEVWGVVLARGQFL